MHSGAAGATGLALAREPAALRQRRRDRVASSRLRRLAGAPTEGVEQAGGHRRLVEDVTEAGAVAEAPQLESRAWSRGCGSHSRARKRRRPSSRAGWFPWSARRRGRGRPRAGTRRGHGRAWSPAREQPVAAGVGAGAVEHEHARPALADRALRVAADVRVLRLRERDRLHTRWAITVRLVRRGRRRRGSGRIGRRRWRSAWLQARARQRLAVCLQLGSTALAGGHLADNDMWLPETAPVSTNAARIKRRNLVGVPPGRGRWAGSRRAALRRKEEKGRPAHADRSDDRRSANGALALPFRR